MILSLLTLLLVVYVCFGLFGYFFAESLIFQPPPPSYGNSSNIIMLPTDDGEQLAATYLHHPDAEYTLLFSHGNAEDIGHLMPLLRKFHSWGFSVFAYDYRGYGLSTGKATEENSYKDIRTAYRYLVDSLNTDPAQIIAHGRSLGGAVAIDLASGEDIGGLIVESSFVSAYRVMTRYPIYPFDRYPNISKINLVDSPVLIMHGKKDRVISFWHGKYLLEKANEPKRHLWVDKAGHNDLYFHAGERYKNTVFNFLEELN